MTAVLPAPAAVVAPVVTRRPVPVRPAGALSIDDLLASARSRIERVTPLEAAARIAAGGLLVDIRPAAQRYREGWVAGALVVERNVLEWRFDPTSDARLPEATGYDVDVLVLCSEGYTSSLAADALRSIGLATATDVVGGFHAWVAAGLPHVAGHGVEPR
ncbi:Rhodanese-related sulfurtransferase [Klenkia soli]|uniref:Rhodanese-related sulfurtransferase n=1 Tax=Klenkia soli TaxID=1052260 RepID=A0A1H0F0R3_9ACTN|nr:rhodanese-like domain-containing protein [Klenkia soli]SDN88163.1 Rhodanese-related sulfurtransferase [Klenkia soli]